MKYSEQFYSTYEAAVKAIDADYEINEDVCDPGYEDAYDSDGSSCYCDRTLKLSAKELVLSENSYYDGLYGTPEVVRQVKMDSGREGIAKLMFRYDIPLALNGEEIDGDAMLETLFEKLSEIDIIDLLKVFIDLNISFSYWT